MGRLTRNCRAANLDAENISPHSLEKRNQKVKQITNVPLKSVLGDRTNLRETNKIINSPQLLVNQNISKKCEENKPKSDTKVRKFKTKGMSNVPLKSKLNLECDKDDEKSSDSYVLKERNHYENSCLIKTDSNSCNKTVESKLKPLVHNSQSSENELIVNGSNRVLRRKGNILCSNDNKDKENQTTSDISSKVMSKGITKSQVKSVDLKNERSTKNPSRILKEMKNDSENINTDNSIGSDTSIQDLSFKFTASGALKLVTNICSDDEAPQHEPLKSLRGTRNCSSVYSRKGKENKDINISKTTDSSTISPKLGTESDDVHKEKQTENYRPTRGKKIFTPRNNDKKLNASTCSSKTLNAKLEKATKPTKERDSSEEKFVGFEEEEIDPFLIPLIKNSESNKQTKTPCKSNHLPVYKTIKSTPNKRPAEKKEDILNLYEFEVDENEPVVKKGKRKPILKMGSKMFRTYKKKKKEVVVLSPLNLSDQGCTKIKPVRLKTKKPKKVNDTVSSKASEKAYGNTSVSSSVPPSEAANTSFVNELEASIDGGLSVRSEILYSPKPYESPKRDSPGVPILRSSIPPSSESPKSLNTSAYSSKCNSVINSPFSSHFGTPAYIGSSTPIHKHWTEHTNTGYSKVNDTSSKNYDVSNCFGFDDSLIEEPFVSPIKMYTTPAKTPSRTTPKKPSPQKLTQNQVIRMLKFNDEPNDMSHDGTETLQNSLQMEELLPDNFFHDGNTPPYEYSPGKSPNYPFDLKNKKRTNKGQRKRVVINDEVSVLEDETHRSLVDKSHNETDITENETVLSNNLTLRTRSRMTKRNNKKTMLPPITESREEASTIEESNPKDFDISTFGQVAKKPRRSYERPEYLRGKKYGDDVLSDVEDEGEPVHETTYITPTKTHQKKKNELSKKEKLELEKWAKAFNEQCMAVESFNLVVE